MDSTQRHIIGDHSNQTKAQHVRYELFHIIPYYLYCMMLLMITQVELMSDVMWNAGSDGLHLGDHVFEYMDCGPRHDSHFYR